MITSSTPGLFITTMEIVCATYAAFGSGLGMDDVPSSVLRLGKKRVSRESASVGVLRDVYIRDWVQ